VRLSVIQYDVVPAQVQQLAAAGPVYEASRKNGKRRCVETSARKVDSCPASHTSSTFGAVLARGRLARSAGFVANNWSFRTASLRAFRSTACTYPTVLVDSGAPLRPPSRINTW